MLTLNQRGEVAPLAGAWIETRGGVIWRYVFPVAPLAGAWIETNCASHRISQLTVAPLAGAWIETGSAMSFVILSLRRAPRGRVD